MFSIFLSLFLGSVLVTAGDTPSVQKAPSKTSETSAAETEPSGVATVVEIKGEAKAVSKSTGKERDLKEGDALYLDETIATGSGSSMQIEIADESLFTLSENTSIRMDLFDLDETNKDGHLTANVAKGVFRFVSGKVAKVKPENVNIEIPSGTIGIRGTVVLGEIEGEKCLVSLEAEEGDKVQHRIVVSNHTGGQTQEVEITKPGFATVIENAGMAPKPIFELPKENRERFAQNLPKAKYLPRDAEGRPAMNPDVRDPKKYPGPMIKRDEQKNTGGQNPPGGTGGGNAGRPENQNLNDPKPGGSNLKGGGKNEPRAFDGKNLRETSNFQESSKPDYEKQGYQLPFEDNADSRTGNQSNGYLGNDNYPQNNFNQSPGEFGNLKPDTARGIPQQPQGGFQPGSFREPQNPSVFKPAQPGFSSQGQAGAFQRPGQNSPNQGNRPGGGAPAQANRSHPGGGPKR